jgi:hypothetical protein
MQPDRLLQADKNCALTKASGQVGPAEINAAGVTGSTPALADFAEAGATASLRR